MLNKDYFNHLSELKTFSKIENYTRILLICVVVILLVLDSCKHPMQNAITELDIYSFLNDVLPEIELKEEDSAIIETPIINIVNEGESNQKKILMIKKRLKDYAKGGWIERKDVDYILSQQFDTTFTFNSNLLEEKLLTQHVLDSITSIPDVSGNLYFALQHKLNINSFCKISKPFFTIDKQTVIVVFEVYRNYLNANGYILIFKKNESKWIEYQKFETWIS